MQIIKHVFSVAGIAVVQPCTYNYVHLMVLTIEPADFIC